MLELCEDVEALLTRALALLDARGDDLPAIHVCQALELLKQYSAPNPEPQSA